MSRSIGWLGLAIGIVLVLVAVFAAQLGLGGASWGIKHILVLMVGIVVGAGGLYGALMPGRAS